MLNRRIMVTGLVLAVVAAALAASLARTRLASRKIAALEPGLDTADPARRLAAATAIIKIDPTHRGARLTKARALVDEGLRTEARRVLTDLEDDPSVGWSNTVLELHAETYLDEAEELLLATAPTAVEPVRESVEALIGQAATLRSQITAEPTNAASRAILEAWELDARAAILWKVLQARRLELSRNRSARFNERSDMLVTDIHDLTEEITRFDRRIGALCEQGLSLRPHDRRARLLMVRSLLRAGDVPGALRTAALMAAQPALRRADAGEVADILLNLDRDYYHPSDRAAVGAARLLLAHPRLTGGESLRFELARAALADREGKPQTAQAILAELLERFPANPSATCMLAMTLLKLGRPADAVALLAPLNERNATSQGAAALGAAYLAAGNGEMGLGAMRQSLELQPDNFPAQLVLIDVLLAAGNIGEAEPLIATAAALGPDHPRVKAARAVLYVQRIDRKGLAGTLAAGPTSAGLTWRHAALVAAMVLDDADRVTQIADELRESREDDPRVLLADGWRRAAPRARAEVAAIIAEQTLVQLDADPLEWPEETTRPFDDAGTDSSSLSDALERRRFVPLPEEIGVSLLNAAMVRWPGQASLIELSAELELRLDRLDALRARLQQLPPDAATPSPAVVAAMRSYLDDNKAAPADPAAQRSSTVAWIGVAQALKGQDPAAASAAIKRWVTDHPWSASPLAPALVQQVKRGNTAQATALLSQVEAVNPAAALLLRGRWELAAGRAEDALRDAAALTHNDGPETELRAQAMEVSARANMAQGRIEVAVGGFEGLSFSQEDRRVEMRLLAVDVLLVTHREHAAAVTLGAILGDANLTPRMLDQVLSRARRVMPSARFLSILDRRLETQPDQVVLLVHKAHALAEDGDLVPAGAAAKRAEELRPEAPRVKMLTARLAAQAGRIDQAAGVCTELVGKGVLTAAAARDAMERFTRLAKAPKEPAAPVTPRSDR